VFSWSPNTSEGQGRALYSFFQGVKDLQNFEKRDPDHTKINPQKLWITQWTTRLQHSPTPMVRGLRLNWRFFHQRKLSLFISKLLSIYKPARFKTVCHKRLTKVFGECAQVWSNPRKPPVSSACAALDGAKLGTFR
jgi:hypothetical protein